jgi:LacI family transcriptional regulator
VRRARPVVIVSTKFRELTEPTRDAIVEQALKFEWNLLDLNFTRDEIPPGLSPSGALVSALPTDPLVKRLRRMGCPVVRLGMLPHPLDARVPAVLLDWTAAGRLAATHFAERGLRNFGCVDLQANTLYEPLYEGLRQGADELGCVCHAFQLPREEPGESRAHLYARRARALGAWLATMPRPIAILGGLDWKTGSLCAMCLREGFAVPEDVVLLGCGNIASVCEMAPVALSSIDFGHADYGRQAALLLRRLMQGVAAPPARVVIPPARIVVRRSSDVLAVGDPKVAHAMRFLWDHLDQNLGVDDVAAEVALSRRGLERRFHEHLGRGVNAELRRKRLERCCELLRTTNEPIADLMPKLGFRSAGYLHRTFRKAFGMTLRQWRIKQAGSRMSD